MFIIVTKNRFQIAIHAFKLIKFFINHQTFFLHLIKRRSNWHIFVNTIYYIFLFFKSYVQFELLYMIRL